MTGMKGRSRPMGHWSEGEADAGAFRDVRLGRRFSDLLRRFGDRMGETIPFACRDWANTKAAYRFFANPNVEEGQILSGHFEAEDALRLVRRPGSPASGHHGVHLPAPRSPCCRLHQGVNSGRDPKGRLRHHAVCGILMHSAWPSPWRGCRSALRRSSSGTARSSRALPSSSARSTRRACRSRPRKASDGSTICVSPWLSSDSRSGASISVTVKATSTEATCPRPGSRHPFRRAHGGRSACRRR